MQLGLMVGGRTVDELVGQVGEVAERGLHSAWAAQIFGFDALVGLAVAAREVPGVQLGTAVVPTYPRHPMALAAQALTVQQVSGGRFHLGIGLSHQIVIESMLGMRWGEVRHLREYLSILGPLLQDQTVAFEGETLTAKLTLDVPTVSPPPVLVAALGPKMLALAGAMADGTVTWMTGPATVASHVSPSIRAAAADAGRPDPRVVVSLPVAVTDDPAEAREAAAGLFSMYGYLPSYRAMLDREGADGPADVAIVGTEAEVRAQIEGVFEQGATEFVAAPFANHERTFDLLGSLA
jgi:5,10-methylenetetrahydromethanopterin reductase